jgi:hypothetical protein
VFIKKILTNIGETPPENCFNQNDICVHLWLKKSVAQAFLPAIGLGGCESICNKNKLEVKSEFI